MACLNFRQHFLCIFKLLKIVFVSLMGPFCALTWLGDRRPPLQPLIRLFQADVMFLGDLEDSVHLFGSERCQLRKFLKENFFWDPPRLLSWVIPARLENGWMSFIVCIGQLLTLLLNGQDFLIFNQRLVWLLGATFQIILNNFLQAQMLQQDIAWFHPPPSIISNQDYGFSLFLLSFYINWYP